MVAMNVYMGLKIGWGVGGSLIAVILSFAFMKLLMTIGIVAGYTTLENNITQTIHNIIVWYKFTRNYINI